MKQFLPFLTDEQGRSLAVKNGVVVTHTVPDPLGKSPEGWENNVIQFARNNEFRALIKSYTPSLKFHFEGAKILRTWFYRKGIESILQFIWLKLDQTFGGGMIHKSWYKGEIDLSTFKDAHDGVEVNITEGGFFKQLQANKTVPYEFPLKDDLDAVSLYHDGMDIYFISKFIVTSGMDISDPNYNIGNHVLDLQEISNEFEGTTSVVRTKIASGSLNASSLHFLESSASGTVKLEYNFNVQVTFYTPPAMHPGATHKIYVRRVNSSNVAVSVSFLYQSVSAATIVGIKTIAGSLNIPVEPGDKLFLYSDMQPAGATGDGQAQFDYSGDNPLFSVDFKKRFAPSIIPAYRAIDLGNKLCRKMSADASGMVSDLLEADENTLITCQDAIRGIPEAVLKTKFSDFHKSIDAIKCVAFGIEDNQGRLEGRAYGYANTEVADLGECRNFKLEVAKDHIYNTVEVGYPSKDVGDVNGRYAFNNTSVYKGPVERVKNVYDAKSIYAADPFAMEITRANYDKKNTTDNKGDNDCYFVDGEKMFPDYDGEVVITGLLGVSTIRIEGTMIILSPGIKFKIISGQNIGTYTIAYTGNTSGGTDIVVETVLASETITTTIEFRHYKLRRKVYASITGIPNPENIFNIELSPARILQNHYAWLKGGFHHLEANKLTWQTTDKNADLVTEDSSGNIITEKADVLIADMGAATYHPYYVYGEVISPYNLLELMTGAHGFFTMQVNGANVKGYTDLIKTNEATLETQEYKLLAIADNDITHLIDGR